MKLPFKATIIILAALVTGAGLFMLNSEHGTFGNVTAILTKRQIENGRLIYGEHCASCHGEDLEGEPNWRTRNAEGRLPAPPHDETGHTWHHPDPVLFDLTKYGPAAIVGGRYESDMPGFEGVLTDAEIRTVLGYIKSTWPEDIRAEQERRTNQYQE